MNRLIYFLPLMAQLLSVSVTVALTWGAVRFRAPAEVTLVALGGIAIDAMRRPKHHMLI